MQVVLDADAVDHGLRRIAGEIAERTPGAEGCVLVGIRRGGVPVAARIAAQLRELGRQDIALGTMDITFYRDDAATHLANPRVGPSDIPCSLDGRHVVLVDDVLFTGRTVRAAMDALLDYGRPRRVQLAVLVDRGGRELPIQADYVVHALQITDEQRVDVVEEGGRLSAIVQAKSSPTAPPPPGDLA